MSGRRQFGSLRRLPSGRWQARFLTVDGRVATAPRTFKTKGDASQWLSTVEADKARGIWLDPSAGRVLLADYATAWLQAKATLAPRTKEIYALQLRLHILPAVSDGVPALGVVPLGEITPDLVRAWYAALVERRGKSVAAKAYVRLRQILNQAVNDDRIAKNACRIAAGGAERHREQRLISLGELYALAAAVRDEYRGARAHRGVGRLAAGRALRAPPP